MPQSEQGNLQKMHITLPPRNARGQFMAKPKTVEQVQHEALVEQYSWRPLPADELVAPDPEHSIWIPVAACVLTIMVLVGDQRLQGPLGLSLDVGVAVPASWSSKRRESALANGDWVTAKPDLSNIVKLVEDAMKGVLWADDAQIACYGHVAKRYANRPEAVLTVWQLEPTLPTPPRPACASADAVGVVL